jgi:hypothetical protein
LRYPLRLLRRWRHAVRGMRGTHGDITTGIITGKQAGLIPRGGRLASRSFGTVPMNSSLRGEINFRQEIRTGQQALFYEQTFSQLIPAQVRFRSVKP